LLLALAIADNLADEAFGEVPTLMLLSEVCARNARNMLKQEVGTDEAVLGAAALKKVSAFLGVDRASAPDVAPLGTSEPQREALMETCSGDYLLRPEAYDLKSWLQSVLEPWAHALRFVRRLRAVLSARGGGWAKLAKDMEVGPHAWADVTDALTREPSKHESLQSLLGIKDPAVAERVLATIAAQAFMHSSSQLRRTIAEGGSLMEPLGDVRDPATLKSLCVNLRMAVYDERVAAKMKEWSKAGASITMQRATAADIDQYASMITGHAHGLDGPTFWGLWHAAKAGGHEKAKVFLASCNSEFVAKHGF